MTAPPAGWDDAAARSPRGHVLQSSAWARVREAQGWSAEYVRIGDPLPVALVLWRSLPLGQRLGYAPRGPVIDASDPASLDRALRGIAALARERGALFVKVDPELTTAEAAATLRERGFRRAPEVQPVVATLELDVAADPDALLAGLEKDTRWSVRQAERRGVRIAEARDDAQLRSFYDIYALTGRRARFITRPWQYYRLVWRTLIDADLATLWLAEHDGGVVAGAMTWRCGERDVYQYGATNEAGRRCYAAYGLQWRAIQAARERGARRYDLGGIPADLTDTSDTMHGPYLFKKGFGGVERRWVGAHDAVPGELAYRAYRALEPLYARATRLAGR